MTNNILPVSTAMWDPKWFHANKKDNYRFMDNNGVINGVRMNSLCMDMYRVELLAKTQSDCESLCKKGEECHYITKGMCPFMHSYAECVRKKNPDFQKFIAFCEGYLQFLNCRFNLSLDTMIFIVHEAPSRPCGERPVLVQWFQENGMELPEWSKQN